MTKRQDPSTTTQKKSTPEKLPTSLAHQFANALLGIKILLQDFYERDIFSPEDTELLHSAINECNKLQGMLDEMRQFRGHDDRDSVQTLEQE